MRIILILFLLIALGAAFWWWRGASRGPTMTDPLAIAEFRARYAEPPSPRRPGAVYHLGHSLVGRDMPAMLSQLMGHRYNSQLGWGATLDQHWRNDVPGFDVENRPPAFRAAREAVASGEYDAIVFTEMVELKDAIRYHDSARALADWAGLARASRPDARLYLYETWHRLDDAAGWLQRLDSDLETLWIDQVLRPAMTRPEVGTIYVIPAGQVMAELVRRIEAGEVPGLTRREDLFGLNADGTQDPIHINDIGAYVVALTHFAVLSGETPVGLPHELRRADGTMAKALSADAAGIIQQVVWEVVRGFPMSGLAQ